MILSDRSRNPRSAANSSHPRHADYRSHCDGHKLCVHSSRSSKHCLEAEIWPSTKKAKPSVFAGAPNCLVLLAWLQEVGGYGSEAVQVEQDKVNSGTLKGGQSVSLQHSLGRSGSIRNSVMSNDVIPSTTDGVARFVERLLRMLTNYRFEDDEVIEIRLAVEEALMNAITHGNKTAKAKEVHITFCMQPAEFSIRIADEGEGFDPDAVPDPTDAEHLDKTGRGLLLMRHFMDAVRFNARGNVVTLVRRRRAAVRRERTQQSRAIAQDAAAPNVSARSTACGSQLESSIALIPDPRPKAGLVLLLILFAVLSCAGWHGVYDDLVEGPDFQGWRNSLGTALAGLFLAMLAVYPLATGHRFVEAMH